MIIINYTACACVCGVCVHARMNLCTGCVPEAVIMRLQPCGITGNTGHMSDGA